MPDATRAKIAKTRERAQDHGPSRKRERARRSRPFDAPAGPEQNASKIMYHLIRYRDARSTARPV